MAYVGTANSGADAFQPSRSNTKPGAAAAGDIAIFYLGRWNESASFPAPTTIPSGAVLLQTLATGDLQMLVYAKYVESGDTTYTFNWGSDRWSALWSEYFTGRAQGLDLSTLVLSGVTGSGNPVASRTVTASAGDDLAWGVDCHEYNGGETHTPPTSFTEVFDAEYGEAAYQNNVSAGSQTASGATVSSAQAHAVILIALPASGGGPSPIDLAPANAAQAHTAGSPALTQVHALAVDASVQAQSAGVPTLTQVHVLSVAGASQAQTPGSPILVQNADLTVQGALQAQSSTDVALTQVHVLTVQAAGQAQAADTVSLSGETSLSVDNALHSQVAGDPALTQVHELSIQGAGQLQTATMVSLTQVHVLAVASPTQAQASDTVVLAGGASLTVADATQAQAVQSVTLTQIHALLVDSAGQSQQAALVALGQIHNLQASGAMQAQESTTVDLVVIGAFEPPDEVEATPRPYISTTTLGGAVSTATARAYESTATVRSPE